MDVYIAVCSRHTLRHARAEIAPTSYPSVPPAGLLTPDRALPHDLAPSCVVVSVSVSLCPGAHSLDRLAPADARAAPLASRVPSCGLLAARKPLLALLDALFRSAACCSGRCASRRSPLTLLWMRSFARPPDAPAAARAAARL